MVHIIMLILLAILSLVWFHGARHCFILCCFSNDYKENRCFVLQTNFSKASSAYMPSIECRGWVPTRVGYGY